MVKIVQPHHAQLGRIAGLLPFGDGYHHGHYGDGNGAGDGEMNGPGGDGCGDDYSAGMGDGRLGDGEENRDGGGLGCPQMAYEWHSSHAPFHGYSNLGVPAALPTIFNGGMGS